MTVTGETVITFDDANAFTQLEELEIGNSVSGLYLKAFPALQRLTLPCYRNDMLVNQYALPDSLEVLTLKPSADCTTVPALIKTSKDISAVSARISKVEGA